MADHAWSSHGADDLRSRMAALAAEGRAFALATIARADGGPRPVGAQMVVTADGAEGFLSGGCVEADVALHAREALALGRPRVLVYGRGSPWADIRLPCGGRIEVLVERVEPSCAALAALVRLGRERRVAHWSSDGVRRRCAEGPEAVKDAVVRAIFPPVQRLVVVGSDPFALAIAAQGAAMGWDTTLVAPSGPEDSPPLSVVYGRRPAAEAIALAAPDPWTAVAVATHDAEADHEALLVALRSGAGYVGVLGARRRLPERLARLRAAGLGEDALARLRAPIGLPLGAATPREVALAVAAEVVACARGAAGAPS